MWLAYLVLFVLLSPGVLFTVPMGKKMGGRLGVVAVHAAIFLLAVSLLHIQEGFQWKVGATPAEQQSYLKGMTGGKRPVPVPVPTRPNPATQRQQAQQQLNQAQNQFNIIKTQYQNAVNTINSDISAAQNALDQMSAQLVQKNQVGVRLAQNIASPTPVPINVDLAVAQTSSDPLISTTKNLINTETKLGNDSKSLASLRQKYNTALQALKTAEVNLARISGVQPKIQPPSSTYPEGGVPDTGLPPPQAGSSGGLFGAIADMSSRMTLTTPTGPPGVVTCGQGEYKYNPGDGNVSCMPCSSTPTSTGNPTVDSENANSMLSCI